MAIMLGGAQFLRWSGLWNLCTEQFVRNVLRRKYSCGNNTEKRRLKKVIKNGLRTTIEIILQRREDWKKLIKNGFRTTIEIILQRKKNIEKMIKNGLRTTFEIILQWREDWKNDQKWFENDNRDCGQNQNPPVMITTVFSGVKWCSMKQEMFFVVKRNSLTSKMEENGLMTKLFPLHFSHRGKNIFYNV